MQAGNDFVTALRTSGFRVTPGKLSILEILNSRGAPMSVKEISRKIRGSIDTVTVYRSLEDLVAKKIVTRVDLGHSHAHYELSKSKPHHHHLVCKMCGKVEDVESCEPKLLEGRVLKKSKKFASIETHAMEFFGLCKECINTK